LPDPVGEELVLLVLAGGGGVPGAGEGHEASVNVGDRAAAPVELLLDDHEVVLIAGLLGEDVGLALVVVVVAGAELAVGQVWGRPVRFAAGGLDRFRARRLASRVMAVWAPMMKIWSSLIFSQASMKWLRGRSYPRRRGGSSSRCWAR